jgi:hypothetical protein
MRTCSTCIGIALSGLGLAIGAAADPPQLPPRYEIKAFATGLDFPTAVDWHEGVYWVTEAGFLPGFSPTVKQVDEDGNVKAILSAGPLADGELMGPLTDITYRDGWLWVAHRQIGANQWPVGAVSRFQVANPVDTFETVITDLPAAGDHSVGEITFDEAGRGYFSIGTATNSSVIGPDNQLVNGWLADYPDFHEFTPVDIVLSGVDYKTVVPFVLDPQADDITGPFMPFGSGPVAPGEVVKAPTPDQPIEGMIAGNGAVYSFDPDAQDPSSTLRLEAWGLRNPYGIKPDPKNNGRMYLTNNGADMRSAEVDGTLMVVEPRPIANDWEDLHRMETGGAAEFFGWPDYFHNPITGKPMEVTSMLFCFSEEHEIPCPDFVLDEKFRQSLTVEPALAQLEYHSSANKFDFAGKGQFGHEGELFIAETGAFVPVSGAEYFSGYKVVRVDPESGEASDFLVNAGETPNELFDPEGFNKPIDVKFVEDVMAVVDFGVFEPGLMLQEPGTGKLWIVSRTGCYADCDASGGTDLLDLLCFVNLFNAGDEGADCDENQDLDLFDFLCFVNAFNEGCN